VISRGADLDPAVLRVATYNVHDLRDDRDAVTHVLRTVRADVLCLQEVPRRLVPVVRLGRFARELAMAVAAAGRGSGGTAVLTGDRVEVLGGRVDRLPVAGLSRTRGVATASLRLPDGTRCTVSSVHLSLRESERVAHANLVLRGLARWGGAPYIVGGDLNEPPQGPSWSVLRERLQDVAPDGEHTFPAAGPRRRIDALLVSPGVRVLAAWVAGEPDGLSQSTLARASDHLPVLADLGLDGR
jgi:endonuclease/exonuclease/phosphatase family metal-dependent hydrolase